MNSLPPIIDKGTGYPYWAVNGVSTPIVPAAGITPGNQWQPLNCDEDGNLIISAQSAGEPHLDNEQATVTPGEEQTLVDETVPDGTTRYVAQVQVVTRVTGAFAVTAGGSVIGSGRTGPGCDGRMLFTPPYPLPAGTEYSVSFMSRLNCAPQGVECYVQATDLTEED